MSVKVSGMDSQKKRIGISKGSFLHIVSSKKPLHFFRVNYINGWIGQRITDDKINTYIMIKYHYSFKLD